jgi:hypothetical protein
MELMQHPAKSDIRLENPIFFEQAGKNFIEYTPLNVKTAENDDRHRHICCTYKKNDRVCQFDVRKRKNGIYNHVCHLVCTYITLDQYINHIDPNPPTTEHHQITSEIRKKLMKFVAASRLSFTAVASEEFLEFVHEIIRSTQTLNPSVPPHAIFPPTDRRVAANIFHTVARENQNLALQWYKNRLVNIMIDAGSIRSNKYVAVAIQSMDGPYSPDLLRLEVPTGLLDTEGYAKIAAKVVDDLFD